MTTANRHELPDAADLTGALETGAADRKRAQERASALRTSTRRVTLVNLGVAAAFAGANWGRLPLFTQLTTLVLSIAAVTAMLALSSRAADTVRAGTPRQVKRLGRIMLLTMVSLHGGLLGVVASGVLLNS